MSNHYQIEYSKKDKGWVPKKQGSDYRYSRIPNSLAFAKIEEAAAWIRETYVAKTTYDTPWIDHVIDGYQGHLMTLEDWKESCDDGGFIDYDGYGDLVTEDYTLLGETTRPSAHTKRKRDYPPEAKYILWYNR